MAALFSKVTGSKYTCKRRRVYEATKICEQPLVKRWFSSGENVLKRVKKSRTIKQKSENSDYLTNGMLRKIKQMQNMHLTQVPGTRYLIQKEIRRYKSHEHVMMQLPFF